MRSNGISAKGAEQELLLDSWTAAGRPQAAACYSKLIALYMVWYGMVEVCRGAPVAVSGWVLTDRHDLAPCAANSLHQGTISVNNITGGTGTLIIA